MLFNSCAQNHSHSLIVCLEFCFLCMPRLIQLQPSFKGVDVVLKSQIGTSR